MLAGDTFWQVYRRAEQPVSTGRKECCLSPEYIEHVRRTGRPTQRELLDDAAAVAEGGEEAGWAGGFGRLSEEERRRAQAHEPIGAAGVAAL